MIVKKKILGSTKKEISIKTKYIRFYISIILFQTPKT